MSSLDDADGATSFPSVPSSQFSFLQDGTNHIISDSDYARKCKRIMQGYQDLLRLGAHQEFDLPKVVVIGSQSTGKSSLVEAVSGINVPRDAGICTRCPMQCTMTRAEEWTCEVEIEWRYDNQHNELDPTNVKRTAFSPILFDKSQVELWIRRAQAAVLAPHRSWDDFTRMTPEQMKVAAKDDIDTLPFSRNTIHVTLRDPEATELSFVDLPGLVQNVDSVRTREMVENLVKDHIQDLDTLILIAMPMTDDIQNQGAVALAKSIDPHGRRIIGVVTKPDMVTDGSIGSKKIWRDIVENRVEDSKLTHGYYCVRLLDDRERESDISRQEADMRASAFFDTTEPWKDMDPTRLGVPNLVKSISSLLISMIEKKIPSLRKAAQDSINKCDKDLASLPPIFIPSRELAVEILLRVSSFSEDLEKTIMGDHRRTFVQGSRARYASFKSQINRSAPNFLLSVQGEQASNSGPVTNTHNSISFEDVRKVLEDSIGWELPGHIPFDATKRLVKQHTARWEQPAIAYFKEACTRFMRLLESLLGDHFGQYIVLEAFIKGAVLKELKDCKEETLSDIRKLLGYEMEPLFTLDLPNFEEKRTTYHEKLSKQCSSHLGDSYRDELTVMSTVQAYFHVASKRFIDYIPLAIEHSLIQQLTKRLKSVLVEVLIAATERMTIHDFLSEDPKNAKRRAEIGQRRARLMEVKRTLDDFGQVEEVDEDEPAAVWLQPPSAPTAKKTDNVGPTVKAKGTIIAAAQIPPKVPTPEWSSPEESLGFFPPDTGIPSLERWPGEEFRPSIGKKKKAKKAMSSDHF